MLCLAKNLYEGWTARAHNGQVSCTVNLWQEGQAVFGWVEALFGSLFPCGVFYCVCVSLDLHAIHQPRVDRRDAAARREGQNPWAYARDLCLPTPHPRFSPGHECWTRGRLFSLASIPVMVIYLGGHITT